MTSDSGGARDASVEPLCGVILAAGAGSRMGVFSKSWPKPLLPVLDRPLMAHQFDLLRSVGIQEVVVVVGHLGDQVRATLGDGSAFGVRLKFVEQTERLGLAHAVAQLAPHVDRPFVLFLGDIHFEVENFESMVAPLRKGGDAQAVLAVKREPDLDALKRNFTVEVDGHGVVSRVVEKPTVPVGNLKGCGIYAFHHTFFDAVKRTPRSALRDEYELTDAVQVYIDGGARVMATEIVTADLNVSYPGDLLDLNLRLLEARGEPNFVSAQASVAKDSHVSSSVVLAGGRVEGSAKLDACLVLDGGVVPAGAVAHRTLFWSGEPVQCPPPSGGWARG